MGGGEPRRRARYRSHDGPEADARRPRPATGTSRGGGSGSAEEESATVVPETALPELSQHASAAGPIAVNRGGSCYCFPGGCPPQAGNPSSGFYAVRILVGTKVSWSRLTQVLAGFTRSRVEAWQPRTSSLCSTADPTPHRL